VKTQSLFRLIWHSSIFHLGTVGLVVLTLSSLVGCGKKHTTTVRDNSGSGQIFVVAQSGDMEKMKEMLKDNPGLVFAKDRGGMTPLHLAAFCGQKGMAELLLAHQKNFDILDAAAGGSLEKIKSLLKDNPDLVFAKDTQGFTPLHWGAVSGHGDVLEFLLTNKADVNARDNVGRTALHFAAQNGWADVVELLLTNKADVNAKDDSSGFAPLHLAAYFGHTNVVELLLANGADFNVRAKTGITPLGDASSAGQMGVAEVLLSHGADINAADDQGVTPLEYAVTGIGNQKEKMVELFLLHRADVNARNSKGQTPLHMAVLRKNTELADLLRQHGGHE
jgi:ankyrin repeat protein